MLQILILAGAYYIYMGICEYLEINKEDAHITMLFIFMLLIGLIISM